MSETHTATALAIVAHADDLEAFAGGLVAKLVRVGFTVHEIIATDNSRGSHLLTRAELIDVSAAEARTAAAILGLGDVHFLGYADGDLCDVSQTELRGRCIEFIRRYRPRIVIGWDPFAPYETHPDHRAIASAACEAVGFAHYGLYEERLGSKGLPPHYVPYAYYFAKHPRDVNRVVNITDVIDKKIEALCAHECQMHLIVQDLAIALRAAGEAWPGGALDYRNYRPAIDMGIRLRAEAAARDAPFPYAEVFRAEAFGGILEQLGRPLPPEPWVN